MAVDLLQLSPVGSGEGDDPRAHPEHQKHNRHDIVHDAGSLWISMPVYWGLSQVRKW